MKIVCYINGRVWIPVMKAKHLICHHENITIKKLPQICTFHKQKRRKSVVNVDNETHKFCEHFYFYFIM